MEKYFIWEGKPELFTIPEFTLPFSVSVLGLILAYLGWAYLQTQEQNKKKTRRSAKQEEKKDFPLWIKGIVLLIGFQLITVPLDLFVFKTFGPLSIRWYGLLFAGSFVVGYYYGAKFFREAGFTQKQIDSLLTYMIVAVVVGARLGHCLFYDPAYYLSNPLEILMIWKGGLASHGAAMGIILAIYFFAKKNKPYSFWMIADRLMIPVAFGAVFIRLGNFFNSEIIGKPTDLPWAIIFAAEDMLPRHPTMLYESLSYVGMLAILFYMYKSFNNNPPEGLMLGVFLVYIFTARFIIEVSKTSQAAYDEVLMSTGQWLSIPFILAGLWILINVGLKNYKKQQLQ